MQKRSKKEIIRGNMKIKDVLERYPSIARVFFKYHLNCMGCQIAAWETIEEGAMAHLINKKTFSSMMKEINAIAIKEKAEKSKK